METIKQQQEQQHKQKTNSHNKRENIVSSHTAR